MNPAQATLPNLRNLMQPAVNYGWRHSTDERGAAVVYNGPSRGDLLAFVDSSPADAELIAALPHAVLSATADHAVEHITTTLHRVAGSPPPKLLTPEAIRALLTNATPGPWRLDGVASIIGASDGQLDVGGHLCVVDITGKRIVRLIIASVDDLVSARFIVEAANLLRRLVGLHA